MVEEILSIISKIGAITSVNYKMPAIEKLLFALIIAPILDIMFIITYSTYKIWFQCQFFSLYQIKAQISQSIRSFMQIFFRIYKIIR